MKPNHVHVLSVILNKFCLTPCLVTYSMIVLPRELCQFSVNDISGYAWHICVKYRLLLIE